MQIRHLNTCINPKQKSTIQLWKSQKKIPLICEIRFQRIFNDIPNEHALPVGHFKIVTNANAYTREQKNNDEHAAIKKQKS